VSRRIEAYLYLGGFLALLAFGLWALWQVGSGFPPEAPPEFLEIERHLRAFAWALTAFSAFGFSLALALLRGKRWGYKALASLLTLMAISAIVVRVIMPPRVVVDPDWPLVFGLFVIAGVCWRSAIADSKV
jgi:hypothetical protein